MTPSPPLPQYSERSSCLVGSSRNNSNSHGSCELRSELIGFRLRAGTSSAATGRHDAEQEETTSVSPPCASKNECVNVRACEYFCPKLLDYWNFQFNYTPSA